MKNRMGKTDWEQHIEKAIGLLEENEKACDRIEKESYRAYAIASYRVARKKYEKEKTVYQKALDGGHVVVDAIVELPFKESLGGRLSKFFTALKEEGKILAIRCSECRRVIFPPRAVCGFCRITVGENEKDWFQLQDTGIITSIILPTEREVDRATARIVGESNPCAFIRLDGGDEWTVFVHYLEMIDMEKLERGMKVKAVWKPKAERRGRASDIAYFRII